MLRRGYVASRPVVFGLSSPAAADAAAAKAILRPPENPFKTYTSRSNIQAWRKNAIHTETKTIRVLNRGQKRITTPE